MSTDSNDSTAIDIHSRGPLLLLLGSGVLWLVISGVLALIASIQLHTPTFFADCAWLTFGRAQALRGRRSFTDGWPTQGLRSGFGLRSASVAKQCVRAIGSSWAPCFGTWA